MLPLTSQYKVAYPCAISDLFPLFVNTAHLRADKPERTLDHLSLAWIFSNTKPSGFLPKIFPNSLVVKSTHDCIGKTLYSIHKTSACLRAKSCVVFELNLEGIFTAMTLSLPRANTSKVATTAESTQPDNPIMTLSFLINLKYSFNQYTRASYIFSISVSQFSINAHSVIDLSIKDLA
jgi:hypothetical protein